MTGYVRQDTENNIADGNVINADDLDNEFDGIQAAFNSSTGHSHDGTTGGGAAITTVGPTQDFVVSAVSVTPKLTDTIDIGTSGVGFKDLYLTGSATIGVDAEIAGDAAAGGSVYYGDRLLASSTAADGTAAAPAISVGFDYDTGFYRPATNTIAMSVGGVESLRLSNLGNLGLGQTPAAWGTSHTGFQIESGISLWSDVTGYSNAYYTNNAYFDGTDRIRIQDGYVAEYRQAAGVHSWLTSTATGVADEAATMNQAMTLTAAGNLGIGTSSPSALLTVNNASGNLAANFVGTTGAYAGFWNGATNVGYIGSAVSIVGSGASADLALRSTAGNLVFAAGGNTERMRLDSEGNLGLGVTPSAWASGGGFVQVPGNGFLGNNTNTSSNAMLFGANAYYDTAWKYKTSSLAATLFQAGNGSFTWRIAPSGTAGSAISFTQAMTLNTNGNLSLGTTSSTYRLTVYNDNSDTVTPIARFLQYNAAATDYATFQIEADAANNLVNLVSTGTNAGGFTFKSASTERMRIDSSGNVGIGTSSPASPLDVTGSLGITISASKTDATGKTGRLRFQHYTNAEEPVTGLLCASSSTSNTLYIGGGSASENAASTIQFYTAANSTTLTGTERMRLDSSGNLGLGVTPSAWDASYKVMELAGAGTAIYSSSSSNLQFTQNAYVGTVYTYGTSQAASRYVMSAGNFYWYTAPSGTAGTAITFTQAMTLDASGDLYLGGTSVSTPVPLDKAVYIKSSTNGDVVGYGLYVADGVNERRASFFLDDTTGTFGLASTYASGGPDLVLNTGGNNTRLRIKSDGEVIVGAGSSGFAPYPASTLQIYGGEGTSPDLNFFRDDPTLSVDHAIGHIAFYGSAGTSGTPDVQAYIYVNAAATHATGSTPTYMSFATTPASTTTPAEAMRIDSGRNLLVGTTTSPSNTNTIAVPSGIYVGGTAAANHFGAYEEGTWTPVVADAASGGVTGTATVAYANYRRYGAIVTVTASITNISTAGMTAANPIYIRGLPFTSSASNNSFGVAQSDTVTFQGGRTSLTSNVGPSDSWITLATSGTALSDTNVDVSDLSSGVSDIYITITYFIA